MAAKKSIFAGVRRSKCLRILGAVKPSAGDGLILGAFIGFLLGLAIGINAKKTGEDLGVFALECGVRGSVACAILFGIFLAVRMAIGL